MLNTGGGSQRSASRVISIDGVLDEAAWAEAPKHNGFTQRFAKGGARSDARHDVLDPFDDEAIYVGVWVDDSEPQKIRHLLTRRDVDSPADAMMVGIDSYHDKRTGYAFQLKAAGVQRDMLLFNNSQTDDTCDAVWTSDVSVNNKGWTGVPNPAQPAAVRPRRHQWGFQIVRLVGRTMKLAACSRGRIRATRSSASSASSGPPARAPGQPPRAPAIRDA